MRLTAKILKNVSNVNHWEYADSAYIQEGNANSFYFQLVDIDKIHSDEKSKEFPDFPLRYIPQGATIGLEVTFEDINPDNQFTVTAVQPFSDDKSIFQVVLGSSQVPNSGSLSMKLTEDGVDKNFIAKNAIKVNKLNVGGC